MVLPTSLLRFKYQTFRAEPNEAFPTRTQVSRPVIDIQLIWSGKSTEYRVLVDSGADLCIFHSDVAEALGIPVTQGKKLSFYGTGGTPQTAFFHAVQIVISGWTMDLYCGFSSEMKSLPYGILGQSGFFDKFKIEFDYRNKRLEFKPKH